ncbi:MAG: DUF4439 domain-containing protein [Propioniciclava sp.]
MLGGRSLSRRALLQAGASSAVGLTLGGCARQPDRPNPAAPSRSLAPAGLLAGQAALQVLVAGLDAASTRAWPSAQAALIQWAGGVVRDQCLAVSLPLPSPMPTPGASAPQSAPQAQGSLQALFSEAQTAFRSQALDSVSARPLVWAGMAAWAAVMGDQVADPAAPREPARTVLSPAPQSPSAAVQASLTAAEQAIYGLSLLGGTAGLPEPDREALSRRITFWRGIRDQLRAMTPTATALTPAAPWFDLELPGDAPSTRAATAHLESATLPVLGRTLAYGPLDVRPIVADAMVATARSIPAWGAMVERWPGLPRS